MADNKRKVAVYLRLAMEDNARIESQKVQVLRYAKEQGHANLMVYADNGESGSNMNRPAFLRMNDDIKSDLVNQVIVHSISRIGRNVVEVMEWINDLRNEGIEVTAIDGSTNFGNSSMFVSLRNDILRCIKKGGKRNGA